MSKRGNLPWGPAAGDVLIRGGNAVGLYSELCSSLLKGPWQMVRKTGRSACISAWAPLIPGRPRAERSRPVVTRLRALCH